MINEGTADYAIVTSYPPDWERLTTITDQLKWEYAKQHGYHYFADCSNLYGPAGTRQNCVPVGEQVPIMGFIKFELLLHFLPKYKGVVWMDADLVLTNREITLESFFARMPDNDVIVEEDWNGFHSTVIFARNTPRAYKYLWASNRTGRGFYLGDPWHEMTSMRNFWLDHIYHDTVGFLPVKDVCPIRAVEYEAFNVPREVSGDCDWKPGDFALHLSALSFERRLRLAEHYADDAHHDQEPPPGP